LKKNIIITGAAGFLGSYFCEFLAKKNYNVIGLDNDQKKVKSLNSKFKKININNLNFYTLDIANEKKIETFKRKLNKDNIRIHYLINNAAIDPPPKENQKKKLLFQRLNSGIKN